jgi:transglutaminase-like putative cysteine protease
MASDVKYTAVRTTVRADDNYRQEMLPMPFPALSVQAPGKWRFQPEGRVVVGEDGQTVSGEQYNVTSMQVTPTAAQLAAAPAATGKIAEQYTKVPDSLPAVVGQTAQDVTSGASSDYQRALMLQDYFTSGQFVYSTTAKAGTGVDAIARFLQTKTGYCVHFAFTMAAMARTLNIPARVAIGFTPGTQGSDGEMSVTLKDAHAWPELYFEGIGWTRFEPTPYRGSEPSYTQTAPSTVGSGQADTAPRSATTAPDATSSATATCTTQNRVADCGTALAAGGTGSNGGGFPLGWTLLAAAVLLVLLLVAAPQFWRARVRAGRLGGDEAVADGIALASARSEAARDDGDGAPARGGGRPRVGGLALSAWREVVDSAWDYGILPDDSETPRRASARLIAEGRLTGPAAEAIAVLATAVEQSLYAPDPRPVPGLPSEVHRVRAGLRESSTRRARLRARFLPRSSARLLWSLSTRWTTAADRFALTWHRLAAPLRRRLTREAPQQ